MDYEPVSPSGDPRPGCQPPLEEMRALPILRYKVRVREQCSWLSAGNPSTSTVGVKHMSKGMDRKKETRKKPAKSMKEKRAEKKAKREARGF